MHLLEATPGNSKIPLWNCIFCEVRGSRPSIPLGSELGTDRSVGNLSRRAGQHLGSVHNWSDVVTPNMNNNYRREQYIFILLSLQTGTKEGAEPTHILLPFPLRVCTCLRACECMCACWAGTDSAHTPTKYCLNLVFSWEVGTLHSI